MRVDQIALALVHTPPNTTQNRHVHTHPHSHPHPPLKTFPPNHPPPLTLHDKLLLPVWATQRRSDLGHTCATVTPAHPRLMVGAEGEEPQGDALLAQHKIKGTHTLVLAVSNIETDRQWSAK